MTSVIADIGCDHGLLSLALALQIPQRYQKVIGVDVSTNALQNAHNNLARFRTISDNGLSHGCDWGNTLVEWRVGDGLSALNDGECNSVCIAGMGVNSILTILNSAEVERVGCHHLFLQPTNARPKFLMLLYNDLSLAGWCLRAEQIEKVSGRWYLSSFWGRERKECCERSDDVVSGGRVPFLPGDFLQEDAVWEEYVRFHKTWLEQDAKKGDLNEMDLRWLQSLR